MEQKTCRKYRRHNNLFCRKLLVVPSQLVVIELEAYETATSYLVLLVARSFICARTRRERAESAISRSPTALGHALAHACGKKNRRRRQDPRDKAYFQKRQSHHKRKYGNPLFRSRDL